MTRFPWSVAGVVLLATLAGAAQEAPTPGPPREPREGRQGERREGQQGPGREGQRRFMGVGGTITEIKGSTVKLKTMNGDEATVKVTEKTEIRKEQKPAQLSDFKPGEVMIVAGERAADGSWTAQRIFDRSGVMAMMSEGLGKQFIAGKVKEINGTSITMERVDQQVQTIEVDDNTSFRRRGESITLADIKPGDGVAGRGQLNKDGVFVPTVLNVGDFPTQMRQGPASQQPQQPPPAPKP